MNTLWHQVHLNDSGQFPVLGQGVCYRYKYCHTYCNMTAYNLSNTYVPDIENTP